MATQQARCRDLGDTPTGGVQNAARRCARATSQALGFRGSVCIVGRHYLSYFVKFIESPGKASECFFLWELDGLVILTPIWRGERVRVAVPH